MLKILLREALWRLLCITATDVLREKNVIETTPIFAKASRLAPFDLHVFNIYANTQTRFMTSRSVNLLMSQSDFQNRFSINLCLLFLFFFFACRRTGLKGLNMA